VIGILQPFAISFLVGLIIGIERERSHPIGSQAMGVRTLTLLALLGTIAAWIDNTAITVILGTFTLGIILLSYYRTTTNSNSAGITTEISAAMVFCLGYISIEAPFLTAVIGVTVLLVLVGREKLHTFSRDQLTKEEIRASITILIISLVVLPFLPDRTIDPWNLFNPQRFGLLILIIAAIQFGGYITIRVFGQKLGISIAGFFGGLVSSTAVFANLPRLVKEEPKLTYHAVAAGILATIGMLVELSVILLIVSPPLFLTVCWAIFAMIGVGLLSTFLVTKTRIREEILSKSLSPLDLKTILRLASLIGGMIFLVALTKHFVGIKALHLFSFLAGLFNVQSITLATANLQIEKQISLPDATLTVGLILLASYVTKFVIIWTTTRSRFAVLTTAFLLAMIGAGIAAEAARLAIS